MTGNNGEFCFSQAKMEEIHKVYAALKYSAERDAFKLQKKEEVKMIKEHAEALDRWKDGQDVAKMLENNVTAARRRDRSV